MAMASRALVKERNDHAKTQDQLTLAKKQCADLAERLENSQQSAKNFEAMYLDANARATTAGVKLLIAESERDRANSVIDFMVAADAQPGA